MPVTQQPSTEPAELIAAIAILKNRLPAGEQKLMAAIDQRHTPAWQDRWRLWESLNEQYMTAVNDLKELGEEEQ